MSTKTNTPDESPRFAALAAKPANLIDHEADMERRAKERAGKRKVILDCLDPTVAKAYEERKDLFEWRVQVKLFRAAKGKAHAHMEAFDEMVVAQNDNDAWSMFCDKISEWPSRRDSEPTITKVKKRTLRADEV